MNFFPKKYSRLITKEVNVGGLIIGNGSPIKIQTMTTTDTMDTAATVAQTIRCIEAGAQLVRITAPSMNEANNLLNIKNELRKQGYTTPLVADIHFTPNAAEVAAKIIEKVRVNPGNYVEKKKFELIEYTDAEYAEEMDRIRERFTPLVKICKEHGTAMRIGTNHGSLSDRIMSRYGDTPMGMVESALEFLRICRNESYHNIVLSMKSSNPQVMVQAYRMLVDKMSNEFGECYPLHLGVTEAGDGEDGRIKSAIGIGTLLEDGIGDTIRVSLTEDPEFEIPVCKDIVKDYIRFTNDDLRSKNSNEHQIVNLKSEIVNPFEYKKRNSIEVSNIGGKHVPVVIADFMQQEIIRHEDLQSIGYTYNSLSDKWTIGDAAADFIYTGKKIIPFALPGTLKVICDYESWKLVDDKTKYFPLIMISDLRSTIDEAIVNLKSSIGNFVSVNTNSTNVDEVKKLIGSKTILCLWSDNEHAMPCVRDFVFKMIEHKIENPIVICVESHHKTVDEQLIDFAKNSGALLLDGMGDGIWLMNDPSKMQDLKVSGRTYLPVKNDHQFLNNTSFSILQATRTRISKTEYISCPSCGRTLFDLQETTAKIRAVTNHLKGLKIAIMGCIVNGPGEMADADYGYVGSGPGKITLYKSKEVVKKGLSSDVAVNELIQLIKDNGDWVEN
jgi:(E)-4-hydroxy-3-methylbut-2-enyl-diphosphate synthase